jgi:hypothetical protein
MAQQALGRDVSIAIHQDCGGSTKAKSIIQTAKQASTRVELERLHPAKKRMI